jgi:uncharacterized membrane protein YeaQ/YmgE (transglycosylase-associated protein family)
VTNRLITTAVVYVVAGMLPPLFAIYVLRTKFVGGVWVATIVGLVGAFAGGLIDTMFLTALPDLILVGAVVDAGPPLLVSLVFTVLFGIVSRSNSA